MADERGTGGFLGGLLDKVEQVKKGIIGDRPAEAGAGDRPADKPASAPKPKDGGQGSGGFIGGVVDAVKKKVDDVKKSIGAADGAEEGTPGEPKGDADWALSGWTKLVDHVNTRVKGVVHGVEQALSDVKGAKLSNPRWSKGAARIREDVSLSVDVEGVEEGTTVFFKVLEHDQDGQHDLADHLKAAVRGGTATAAWQFKAMDDKDDEQSAIDRSVGWQVPEYIFEATCGDATIRCNQLLVFKDFIHIAVRTPDGKPYVNEEYELCVGTFTRRGNTGKEGIVREESVPPGRMSIRFVSRFKLTLD